MKKIYSLLACVIVAFAFTAMMTVNVHADEAKVTSMTVKAHNMAGEQTEIKLSPAFSEDVLDYTAVAPNDTIKLVIEAAPASGCVYDVRWEALDVGDNDTFVDVTAADGTKVTYTIKTKRLTEEEEATYVAEENNDDTDNNDDGNEGDDGNVDDEPVELEEAIVINDVNMKVGSFNESDVPEGFEVADYDFKGSSVKAIKGTRKSLVAIWLEPETEGDADAGFYIYDEESDSFYKMHNMYVQSRMYTVVNYADYDKYLDDYDKSEVEILGETVEAWVLDETNSLYLLYAMNWEGETSLYCYDDIEKCFQRYIINSAAANQLEGANDAINNLQAKNKKLVEKYNKSNSMKWKIIAGLLIIIVILFFVSLNLLLKLKTKNLTDDMTDDDRKELNKKNNKSVKPKKEKVKKEKNKNDIFEDEYDEEEELFKLVEDEDDYEDDFIVVSQREDKMPTFDIDKDEIDISSQVMKELVSVTKDDSVVDTIESAKKESKDDDEDDGFVFI